MTPGACRGGIGSMLRTGPGRGKEAAAREVRRARATDTSRGSSARPHVSFLRVDVPHPRRDPLPGRARRLQGPERRRVGRLVRQQPALHLEAAAVAAEPPLRLHHAVAGDEDRDGVLVVRATHRARGTRRGRGGARSRRRSGPPPTGCGRARPRPRAGRRCRAGEGGEPRRAAGEVVVERGAGAVEVARARAPRAPDATGRDRRRRGRGVPPRPPRRRGGRSGSGSGDGPSWRAPGVARLRRGRLARAGIERRRGRAEARADLRDLRVHPAEQVRLLAERQEGALEALHEHGAEVVERRAPSARARAAAPS